MRQRSRSVFLTRMDYGHNSARRLERFGEAALYIACDVLEFLVSSLFEIFTGL